MLRAAITGWLAVAWLAVLACGETEKSPANAVHAGASGVSSLAGANYVGEAPTFGGAAAAERRALTCGDGKFVPPEQVCDGIEDCQFGTDEKVCPVYYCADGWYLSGHQVCDGVDDCAGAEDERADQCATVATGFVCSGTTRIARRQVCDDKPDCANAADEANCPAFLCFDGALALSRTKRCDGVGDCGDGSDEENCTVP